MHSKWIAAGGWSCFVVALATAVHGGNARAALEQQLNAVTADLGSTRNQLSAASAELGRLRPALDAATAKLKSAEEALEALKHAPQHLFDEAARAGVDDTDAADTKAIERFREIVARFPTDPLAAEADKRVVAHETRIKTRAEKLHAAQAEVRRLIAACKRNHTTYDRIQQGSVGFNYFGDLDMNAAMAGARQAEPYSEASTAAKEQAQELLKTVPDPDDKLKDEIEGCDQ